MDNNIDISLEIDPGYSKPQIIIRANEKTKFIALGTTLAAIINIVLNAIFIPRYGYVAAAYTTLVTYALYFLFHYYLYRHIEKEKIYSVKAIVLSIIVVMLAGGVSLMTIQIPILRIALAAFMAAGVLLYFEKTMKISAFIRKRLHRN